uniref:Cuticle protein 6 n=1 Tax=Glossina palpalis gambiensis TaxID=67801 RepID=A0A1B0B972_9MUSC
MNFYCILITYFVQIITNASCIAEVVGKELSKANSYFYMSPNGDYRYAYRTTTGMESGQSADATNEVKGYYMYYNEGIPFMVKYRAGVQGFQPEIIPLAKLYQKQVINLKGTNSEYPLHFSNMRRPTATTPHIANVESLPYSSESSTAVSISSSSNHHYQQPLTLGEVTELNNLSLSQAVTESEPDYEPDMQYKRPYSFAYRGEQSSHSESSDNLGNVVGSYSYRDDAGYHDLSYKAGDNIGFVVLGGNLLKASDQYATTKRKRFAQFIGSYNDDNKQHSVAETQPVATSDASVKRSLRKFQRYTRW